MITWSKLYTFGAFFLAGLLFAVEPALSAQKKVSDLTALTGANTATDDDFLIVDTGATESKRITRDELAIGLSGPMGIVVESVPGTAATATGTDAIGIGDGAVAGNAAGDNGVIAIGTDSGALGANSISIGQFSDAAGDQAIAIGGRNVDGNGADASGDDSISLGPSTTASGDGSVAIGDAATASGGSAFAFGTSTLASGSRSLAFLQSSQSSADQTIAIGYNTDATGNNCIAIGGNSTDTDSADCSGADSIALGQHILADDIGEFAFASGEFATQSDAHTSIFVLRNSTTDGTQTEIFADGSAGDISVPSGCAVSLRLNVVGRAATGGGGYLVSGVFDNQSGTTALIGSASTTTVAETDSNWDVTVTADDTNDGINVLVTGAVGTSINWVARAEIAESCG